MSSPSPVKRPRQRQACEPCRRKKTRCPGERPTCSFCRRLGQSCAYADEVAHLSPGASALAQSPTSMTSGNQQLESRVEALETKLAEALASLSQTQLQGESVVQNSQAMSMHIDTATLSGSLASNYPTGNLPPWHVVTATAEKFLLYCDCQPLPLFCRKSFVSTLRTRDLELIFSILAFALRFLDVFSESETINLTKDYAETARRIIMHRISEGKVELSTLQSLCLLSFVDFTHGYKHRASIHINLAVNLAHCAGLSTESSFEFSDLICEERRRCFWSILMLKRLHSADDSILDFPDEENFPRYPTSTGANPNGRITDEMANPPTNGDGALNSETKDAGVMAHAIQLTELWFKTARYARRRGKPSKLPPWSPQSEYATILAKQMELETCMPYKHRFKPAGFSKFSTDQLQQNRDYWGPWLFMQFLYHTNLCLLNHPLILALRLRNIGSVIPEIFLQNTSDLITSHTSWIMHLINMLHAKSYNVTDPFLGHCAAIVATIHLQESFTGDPDVRKEKSAHFATCLEFIKEIGQQWPHMFRLAEKLQQLQATVSASYQHRNSASQNPTRSLLIDLARFWEILEYSSASETYEPTGQLFGLSLYLGPHQSTTEFSNTSTLPPPTRVDPAIVGAFRRRGTSRSDVVDQQDGHRMPNDGSAPHPSASAYPYGYVAAPPYSNDELEVLADSLFNQRQDFGGDAEDWWRNGNL